MTQYRLDKATDTFLKLDEKEGVWRPTDDMEQRQAPAVIPPMSLMGGGGGGYGDGSGDVIIVGAQGAQHDDATTIAKGTLMRSLPVMGMFLPLGAAITLLGVVLGVVGTVLQGTMIILLIWGGGSLYAYVCMANNDHKHSYYGVERLKVESLTDIKQQELANDYALKRAALDAYIRRLGGG